MIFSSRLVPSASVYLVSYVSNSDSLGDWVGWIGAGGQECWFLSLSYSLIIHAVSLSLLVLVSYFI